MTLFNRTLVFFIMLFSPIMSCFADTQIKLSAEESQAMSQFLNNLEPNEPTLIDLTQPKNEKGYIALLKSHNITEQTHPDIFEDIETMKAHQKVLLKNKKRLEIPDSVTKPKNYISHPRIVFSENNKSISATVFASLYFPGSNISNSNTIETNAGKAKLQGGLSIISSDNQDVKTLHVSVQESTKNNGVRNFVLSTPEYNLATFEQHGNTYQAISFFQGEINGIPLNNAPIVEKSLPLQDLENSFSNFFPQSMENKAPTYVNNSPEKEKPIIVCLNRANPEPGAPDECDYGPTSPGKPNDQSTIKLEIIGNVTFKNPIAIDKNRKPIAAQGISPAIDLTLVGLDTGGACKLARDINEDTFWKHKKVNNDRIKGNNTNLSWEFSKNTGYADFGPICWPNNERYILDLQATIVTMQGDNVFPVLFSYTNNPGSEKSASQLIYPPIQIQYGCIAEGTLIDMADGSKWKVENIRPGDKVLTKQGGILQVKSRIVGHDTEFVDLTYNNSEQISLTPTHPVSTSQGIVKAEDLKVGDTIHTLDGQITLTSVKQRKSEPLNVYNFVLEKTDSQSELLPEDAVLSAGGILVGDNNLQRKVSISN
ncbi:Hint domain-containing protein [Photorhabdus australis]|uniref:Hint domain-containing protein n=1 Tax=Photorhabdus australis TaxID=286156 RepID=UPI00055C513F|nr:Hint domain-containing protein [Photorhabdus australis]